MTPCACRKILDRSAHWSYATGNMAPPRDPDDDDEAEDEEDDDRSEDLDPPAIREPDE